MAKTYQQISGDGGSDIVGQVAEQGDRLRARMQPIKGRVAVVSGKGGVGKSAITVNLAMAAAMAGALVGILDADLNGPSIAKMTGVRSQRPRLSAEGVHPVAGPAGMRIMSMDLLLPHDDAPLTWQSTTPSEAYLWRSSMEATALREFLSDTIWGELDCLFLDLPPGTDRIATLAGIVPELTGVIVVTIPSEVSHLVVRRSLRLARDLHIPVLGVLENMAGYHCQSCQTVGALFRPPEGAHLAHEFGLKWLGEIPFDPRLTQAADGGVPFVALHPATATGQLFQRVAGELLATIRGATAEHTERRGG